MDKKRAHTGTKCRIVGLLACTAVTSGVLLAAFPAQATAYDWTGADGTDWFTSGDWSPSGIPGSGDTVEIDLTNGPVVSTAGAQTSTFYLAYGGPGALTIENGGSVSNGGYSFVGVGAAATLLIEGGGTLSDNGSLLGLYSPSMGTTATVTGMGSAWTTGSIAVGYGGSATLAIENGGSVNSGFTYVGYQSSGTLTIESGSTLSDNGADIGVNGGSNGAVIVDGAGSSWTTGGIYDGYGGTGTLTVENNGSVNDRGSIIVGGNGGSNGTLIIQSGGTLGSNISDIGVSNDSTGTVTVAGAGSSWSMNALTIGDGGEGTLTVEDGGSVSTNYSFSVGNSSGSIGALTIASNGVFTVGGGGTGTVTIASQSGSIGALNIGASVGNSAVAPGTLDAADVAFGAGAGTIVFNHTSADYVFAPEISGNGTIDALSGTTVLTGNSTGFTGAINVDTGGIIDVQGSVDGSQINIGINGTGTFNLQSGGTLSDNDGYIGINAGSSGTATVSGTGTAWSTGGLVVGESGTGALNIGSAATINNNATFVGNNSGSVGTLTIESGGGLTDNTTYVGLGGTGALIIESGGTLSDDGGVIGANAGSIGAATVTGAGSSWGTAGITIGDNGTGALTVENSGTVHASGVGAGEIILGNNSGSVGSLIIENEGELTDNTTYVGSGGTGTLVIQGGSTLSDSGGVIGANAGSIGSTTVTGTGSRWETSGITIGDNGTGVLTIENSGTVHASGVGADEIILGNNSGSVGTLTIESGGGLTDNTTYVGLGGTGALVIQGGGMLTDNSSVIGANAGATGTATVTGTGSNWTTVGMTVGGSGAGALIIENRGTVTNSGSTLIGAGFSGGGSGALTIESGATLSDVTGLLNYSCNGSCASSTARVTVTGAGSTWNNSGDLYIGDGDGDNTAVLSIADGGVVATGSGAIYRDFNNGPHISSSTVYIAAATGNVDVLNIGAASSETASAPGVLEAASVVFGAGIGSIVFNHTSDDYVFAPTIRGNGSIDVLSGATVLTADNSGFLGATTVSGGTLEVDNVLAGTLDVVSGGTLQGIGIIGTTHIASGAVIAPGRIVGSGATSALSVSGNYIQAAGATMAIILTPSATDRLLVSGTASLNGTLMLTPTEGAYMRGTTYEIVNAAGGLIGTFASVANTAPATAQFAVSYGADDVILTTQSGIGNFTNVATTTDQKNIAATLENVSSSVSNSGLNATLNALSIQSGAGQQQGLDELDGHIAPGLVSGAGNNLRAAFNGIAAHLGNAISGEGLGMSFALTDDRPGSLGVSEDLAGLQVADASNMVWGPDRGTSGEYSVWMQGIGESIKTGSTSTGPGMTSTLGGGTFGFEWRPTQSNNIGIVFGAASTDVSITSQTGQQTTYLTGLYGRHDWDQYVLDGSALVGYNHATSQRQIQLLSEQANGSTDGYGIGLSSGIGYRIDIDGGNEDADATGEDSDITLTPRIGFNYTYDSENGYTETGAPNANLAVAGSTQTFLQSSVGATLATKVLLAQGDGTLDTLRPEVSIGWLHDFFNPASSVSESFAGIASSAFTTESANPGRDAAAVSVGLSLTPGKFQMLQLYARYDATLSANEADNAVTVGAKLSW